MLIDQVASIGHVRLPFFGRRIANPGDDCGNIRFASIDSLGVLEEDLPKEGCRDNN